MSWRLWDWSLAYTHVLFPIICHELYPMKRMDQYGPLPGEYGVGVQLYFEFLSGAMLGAGNWRFRLISHLLIEVSILTRMRKRTHFEPTDIQTESYPRVQSDPRDQGVFPQKWGRQLTRSVIFRVCVANGYFPDASKLMESHIVNACNAPCSAILRLSPVQWNECQFSNQSSARLEPPYPQKEERQSQRRQASPAEIWAGSGFSSSFSPSQCCKGSPVAPGELAKFHIFGQDGAIFTHFYMALVCFLAFGMLWCLIFFLM